ILWRGSRRGSRRCRTGGGGWSISWSIRTADIGARQRRWSGPRGASRMLGFFRLTRLGLAAALAAVALAGAARGELAPSQTIKIIVGVPAGGLGDLAARILAQRLTETGHPAIVENRLGGNGIIATERVAKP